MNNKRYFSHYESPNIVIVPTTSFNPPSPKRRKIDNNIVVPIVDNAICNKIKAVQENKPDDSKVFKKEDINESSSKRPKQKTSWAENYLHSIGLDKKSSIWNRKIPRKTASQISTKPPTNISTETTTSSTYVPKIDTEKSNQLKIPKKILTESSTLKDSKNKIKHVAETKNLNIKDKFKKSKQLQQRSTLVKTPSDVKINKSRNNKATLSGTNKIKTDNFQKNESHEQSNHLDSHRLHMKSGKVIKKTSQKDNKSKLTINHSPVRHGEKSENKVKKSKIRSVVIKDVQNKRKVNVKAKHNQTKSIKQSPSYSSGNYKSGNHKDKYINPNCPMKKIDDMKSIEATKIGDKLSDLNKLVLKKAQNNHSELKTKSIRKANSKTISKSKTKEKIIKNKTDFTSDKKAIKSPIKRKTLKTENYRKIKLVINVICNKNTNPLQSNESSPIENNSGSKSCTVSNVDLDFLNDFDIDEIVESLDTCDKKVSQNIRSNRDLNKYQGKENTDNHDVISNIQNYNDNTDAIDLIKTLKGEEDDDLIRISTESAQNLLFSNVVNNFTQRTDNSQTLSNVSKSRNRTIPKDFFAELFKTEQKEKLELFETISSNAPVDLDNIMGDKNVGNINSVKTFNINKHTKAKETQPTIMKSHQNLLISNVVNNFTQGTDNSQMLSEFSKSGNSTIPKDFTELFTTEHKEKFELFETVSSNTSDNLDNITADKNVGPISSDKTFNINKHTKAKETQPTIMKNKEKESNFRSQTENLKRDTLDKKLDDNINKSNIKVKGQSPGEVDTCSNNSCIYEDVDQENIKCNCIHKNTHTNVSHNLLFQQNVEVTFNEDQHKNKNSLNHTPKEIANANNVSEILNSKNTSHINSSNLLPTDINYKGNECIQNEETAHDLQQKKLEEPDFTSVKQEDNTFYNNEKYIETVKDVKNIDFDYQNRFINQNIVPQHNANVDNKGNQNNLALIDNELEEKLKVLDRHEDHKEEQNSQEVVTKNKQSDLLSKNMETKGSQNKVSDCSVHGNLGTEVELKTIQKLKEQLYLETGSKYSINSIIHTGRFSEIFKCRHPNGKYYALKIPTTDLRYKYGKKKTDLLRCLVSEIPKNNLFIVNLVNAFNLGPKWCFLMDYYPKNLQQALDEIGKPYPIEIVQDYAKQLVMAVMVLKNKKMVHLDIKPQHVLINSSNNMLKLCGFDLLCRLKKVIVRPGVGTANYRAPEVILGYKSSYEIDVWSTALVLYEMAVYKQLFPGTFNNDILYKQICTLGCIPYEMIKRSRFANVHFLGSRFMKKSGFKGQTISIISKFYKSNRLHNSIFSAYFENWGYHRSVFQQNCDTEKISQFVKLLQKMLTMCPENRLPIEFVYTNQFIKDVNSHQNW